MTEHPRHSAPRVTTTAATPAHATARPTGRTRWVQAAEPLPAPPVFRRVVTLAEPPTRAELRISGLGVYDATVNGVAVTCDRLGPGQSRFDQVALVDHYDVTHLLGPGTNTIDVLVGHGFLDMATGTAWRWESAPWRTPPRLWAELEVEEGNGTISVVGTDGRWVSATGPVRFDSVYEGESYDSRVTLDGWAPALEIASGAQLRNAAHDPVRVHREIPLHFEPVGNAWVADCGEVLSGWVRVHRRAGAGWLSVTHGETLDDTGRVVARNRHVYSDRFQRDDLWLQAGDSWEARLTYKGFRYVELTGAGPDDVEMCALAAYADVPDAGSFACSDEVLCWLDDAFVRTVRANLHRIPTDTPTYEKNGWLGDAQVAAEGILGRLGAQRFLAAWLDDMADAQRPDGAIPVIVPSPGWGYDLECSPAPEWTTCYPYLTWLLVQETGDLDLAKRHLQPLLNYLDRERRLLDADGLAVGILGDYLAPGFHGPPPEDKRLYATALLARAAAAVADLAQSLERSAEAAECAALAEALTCALNRAFLVDGRYQSELAMETREVDEPMLTEVRQAYQSVPLALGLVPPDARANVEAALIGDVEAKGLHHDVGCLGGATLLQALTDAGRPDVALAVATQRTYPGFGVWMESGSRTLLEYWHSPGRSHAHYFQGGAAAWLYSHVAGLRRTSPGWRTFDVAPAVDLGPEGWCRYRRVTPSGEVAVSWDRSAVTVTVPAGAIATVRLAGAERIVEGPCTATLPRG